MGNNYGCCFRIIYHCIFVIFFLNRLFFDSSKENIEMAVFFLLGGFSAPTELESRSYFPPDASEIVSKSLTK
jgi:hypothetical protein